MTEQLKRLIKAKPFRQFIIETIGGNYLVPNPYHIAINEDRGRVVVFDDNGLVEIIDLDAVQIVTVP